MKKIRIDMVVALSHELLQQILYYYFKEDRLSPDNYEIYSTEEDPVQAGSLLVRLRKVDEEE